MLISSKRIATTGLSAMLSAWLIVAASEQMPSDKSSPASIPSNGSPIFDIEIPRGYRDWKLVAVAHEEGSLNDIRAILGNDMAITAYRQHATSFPDGTIIARLAWKYVPSEDNNKVFGRAQSFVAGSPTDAYLQFMVKDSKRYASTGGWGFAQFDKDGRPTDELHIKTCFPCHKAGNARDLVFTDYAVR